MEDTSGSDWRDCGLTLLAIYTKNDKVDKINRSIITSCFESPVTYKARWKSDGERQDRGPAESQFELVVAPTARVMCLVNLDIKGGMLYSFSYINIYNIFMYYSGITNGAIGEVISCHKDSIFCKFGSVKKYIKRYHWTNCKNYQYFSQFPLRLAYGITSYKAQGMLLFFL